MEGGLSRLEKCRSVACPRCGAKAGEGCVNCHELTVHLVRLRLLEANESAMLLFEELRKANDELGRYSDHEGDEGGSTFYFWKQGRTAFAAQCERAIEDHNRAIKLWRKLRDLNRFRANDSAAQGSAKEG